MEVVWSVNAGTRCQATLAKCVHRNEFMSVSGRKFKDVMK